MAMWVVQVHRNGGRAYGGWGIGVYSIVCRGYLMQLSGMSVETSFLGPSTLQS